MTNIEISELNRYLREVSERTANRLLEKTGKIREFITYAEIRKQYNQKTAEAAYKSIKNWWSLGKGGSTSGKYCRRTDFEEFIFPRKR